MCCTPDSIIKIIFFGVKLIISTHNPFNFIFLAPKKTDVKYLSDLPQCMTGPDVGLIDCFSKNFCKNEEPLKHVFP